MPDPPSYEVEMPDDDEMPVPVGALPVDTRDASPTTEGDLIETVLCRHDLCEQNIYRWASEVEAGGTKSSVAALVVAHRRQYVALAECHGLIKELTGLLESQNAEVNRLLALRTDAAAVLADLDLDGGGYVLVERAKLRVLAAECAKGS